MAKPIGTYKQRNQPDTFRHCKICGKSIKSQNSSKSRNRGTYTGLCHDCNIRALGHYGRKEYRTTMTYKEYLKKYCKCEGVVCK